MNNDLAVVHPLRRTPSCPLWAGLFRPQFLSVLGQYNTIQYFIQEIKT